jgi:hypothetical protein
MDSRCGDVWVSMAFRMDGSSYGIGLTNMGIKPRRRPGERASASNTQGRSAYNLAEDKRIRANAKFAGVSLGGAIANSKMTTFDRSPKVISYLAKDEHPVTLDDQLTQYEIELIFKLKDYEEGYDIPLKVANPSLYRKVRELVAGLTKDRLSRARRAKPSMEFMLYAKHLAQQPRYRELSVDEPGLTFPY